MLPQCKSINTRNIEIHIDHGQLSSEKPAVVRFEIPACGTSDKARSVVVTRKSDNLVEISVDGKINELRIQKKADFLDGLGEIFNLRIGTVYKNKRPRLDELAQNIYDALDVGKDKTLSSSKYAPVFVPCRTSNAQKIKITYERNVTGGKEFPAAHFELPACGASETPHKVSIYRYSPGKMEISINGERDEMHFSNEFQYRQRLGVILDQRIGTVASGKRPYFADPAREIYQVLNRDGNRDEVQPRVEAPGQEKKQVPVKATVPVPESHNSALVASLKSLVIKQLNLEGTGVEVTLKPDKEGNLIEKRKSAGDSQWIKGTLAMKNTEVDFSSTVTGKDLTLSLNLFFLSNKAFHPENKTDQRVIKGILKILESNKFQEFEEAEKTSSTNPDAPIFVVTKSKSSSSQKYLQLWTVLPNGNVKQEGTWDLAKFPDNTALIGVGTDRGFLLIGPHARIYLYNSDHKVYTDISR